MHFRIPVISTWVGLEVLIDCNLQCQTISHSAWVRDQRVWRGFVHVCMLSTWTEHAGILLYTHVIAACSPECLHLLKGLGGGVAASLRS